MSKVEDGPLSNVDAQQKRRDKVTLAEIQRQADWRAVMSTRAGRAVMRAILAITKHEDTTIYESVARARIQEGGRAVGVAIITELKGADIGLFRLMEDEQRGDAPSKGESDAA